MIHHLAAAAANCKTGSWVQQWQCGLHQPASAGVTRAGYDFGHNALPVLIMLGFVFLVVTARRRRKVGGRKVEAASKAWSRATPVRRSES